MAKNKSVLNKYIASYETLREFLQYLTSGCYQKEQLVTLAAMSARSYEDSLARTRFFLPADSLITHRVGHRSVHAIHGSRYHTAYNALALSYRQHALSPTAAFYYVLILQLLAAGVPQRESELLARLISRVAEHPPALTVDLAPRTLHRYLTRLAALGLVERLPEKNRYRYQLAPSPLADLEPAEERELVLAIAAYRELALTSIPGYQLAGAVDVPLQLRHSAISRILDDEAVHLITYAITAGYSVRFSYRGASITAQPLRIRTDMRRARSYLIAQLARVRDTHRTRQPQAYRLDRLRGLQLGARLAARSSAAAGSESAKAKQVVSAPRPPLVLSATIADPAAGENLRYHILERYPLAAISEERRMDSTILRAALDVADPLALIPWLRTLEPPVAISSPAHAELQTRLLTDAREALASYDLYTTTP